MSMVAARKFDYYVSLSKASSEPNTTHGRLSATINHTHFFDRWDHTSYSLSHFYLQSSRCAKADAIFCGCVNGLYDGFMTMSQDSRAPGTNVINIFCSVHVSKV